MVNVMTFKEAQRMFKEARHGKKGGSAVIARCGQYRVRLVELSESTYAIQVFNTYVLRIREDGSYDVNLGKQGSVLMQGVVKEYLPFDAALLVERGQFPSTCFSVVPKMSYEIKAQEMSIHSK